MAEEKVGFFKRLVNGLTKTRDSIVAGIDSIFSGYSNIDDDFYEEIEEILVMGDIGINTTTKIIDHLKERVAEEHITDPAECKQLLIESIKKQMDVGDTAYEFENRKSVVLVIGVNGVGKTTSVGRIRAKRLFLRQQIRSVQRQASSSRSGRTAPAWISSADRTEQIRRPSCTMQSQRQKPEMRMC